MYLYLTLCCNWKFNRCEVYRLLRNDKKRRNADYLFKKSFRISRARMRPDVSWWLAANFRRHESRKVCCTWLGRPRRPRAFSRSQLVASFGTCILLIRASNVCALSSSCAAKLFFPRKKLWLRHNFHSWLISRSRKGRQAVDMRLDRWLSDYLLNCLNKSSSICLSWWVEAWLQDLGNAKI